ncbi:MAG: sensor histidine kinase [Ferruginibacter sp.]
MYIQGLQYHASTIFSRILLVLMLQLINFQISAQQTASIRHFTIQDGLAINSVNDILFDHNGMLWAATSDGLQRYDGYQFKTYKNIYGNLSSLPISHCMALWEDEQSTLWISHGNIISFKKPNQSNFVAIKFPKTVLISSFFYESKTHLWSYNKQYVVLIDKTQPSKSIAYPIKFANKDTTLLRIIFEEGFFKHSIFKQIVKDYPQGKELLKGSSTFPSALLHDESALLQLPPLLSNDSIHATKSVLTVTASAQYDSTTLLVLILNKGLYLYHTTTQYLEKHPLSDLVEANINYQLVRNITIDAFKNVWLSQSGKGGIICFKEDRNPFRTFLKAEENEIIYGMGWNNAHQLFVASFAKHIKMYNDLGQQQHDFTASLKQYASQKINPVNIRALCKLSKDDMLWISTNGKVYCYHSPTQLIKEVSNLMPVAGAIDTDNFDLFIQPINDSQVVFNRAHTLVICTTNGSRHTFKIYLSISPQLRITSFIPLNSTEWLIGTTTGLYKWNKDGLIQVSTVPSVHVKHITVDKKQQFWIATVEGICILKNEILIKKFTEQNGLPNNFIYGILFDDHQNAWCTSNKGLIKIDTAFQLKSYNKSNGLLNDEFNTNGFLKHADGRFFLAGLNGIDVFHPNYFREDSTQSNIRLSEVKVNYLSYPFQVNTQQDIELQLSHDQNNLSFSFAVTDFFDAASNQYSYWLKGFQKEWSMPSTTNEVNYILPPGDYELWVKGANHLGNWTTTLLKVKIVIVPAWYQTNGFKILIILAMVGLLALLFYNIYRRRLNARIQQLKLVQQLQDEKERLSRDLHDNLGSQMALLINDVNQLETTVKKQMPFLHNIHQVKETSKQLIQTLRESIWILNKEQVLAQDFFDKLTEYASRQMQSNTTMQLQTRNELIENTVLSSIEALQLFRVCQEAINNAIKYSKSEWLLLVVNTQQYRFQLQIADGGIGFSKQAMQQEGHYGIGNIQQRLQSIRAECNIESTPDKGTSITIQLK